jgi:hypothetical protein
MAHLIPIWHMTCMHIMCMISHDSVHNMWICACTLFQNGFSQFCACADCKSCIVTGRRVAPGLFEWQRRTSACRGSRLCARLAAALQQRAGKVMGSVWFGLGDELFTKGVSSVALGGNLQETERQGRHKSSKRATMQEHARLLLARRCAR